jgi:hypothetical protein
MALMGEMELIPVELNVKGIYKENYRPEKSFGCENAISPKLEVWQLV